MKQPAWGFSRADQWPQGDKGMWDFRKNLGAWKSSFPFSRADPKWLGVKSVDPPPGVGWSFYGPGKDGCVRSFQISKKPITFLGSMIRHLTWLCRHIPTRASRAHAQVVQSFFTSFFSKPYEVFNALLMCVLFPSLWSCVEDSWAMGLGFVSKDSRMVSLCLFPMFPVAWEHPQTPHLGLHMLHRMPTTGKSDVFALKMLVGATLYVVPGMTIAGWLNYFQEGWSFQTTNRSTVQELQQLVFRLPNCSIVRVREFCVTLVPLGWFLASGNCNCNWAIADGCNGQNWQAAHGKDNMPTQSIRVSVPTGFYDCGRTGTEMTTLMASLV